MEPELEVTPQEVLLGEAVNIRMSGLAAAQKATITVSGKDQFGNIWSSSASFDADGSGTIDTARDAPFEGTYEGIDQAGLFWSMACGQKSGKISPFVIMPSLTVTMSLDGQEKASQNISRNAVVDLEKQELTSPVVGAFFRPGGLTEPTPALIVLGGSEGGYNQGWAAVIASATRLPTLALGYFGAEGLPSALENIPLEIIGNAFEWLNSQPGIVNDRFGLVGASRGGELAMLAASVYPQIRAVVGYTPSGVVWQGLGEKPAPAWTYQGKPFPWLEMMTDEESEKAFVEAQKNGTAYLDSPTFVYSLKMQQSRIPEAAIPVEKSRSAFLLIGNPHDGVWPSHEMSKIAIDRLKAHNHPYTYDLLSYDQGGHMLIPYPYYPTTMRQLYLPTFNIWEGLGGNAEAAARAAEDSWPRFRDFLRQELCEKERGDAD